MGAVRARADRRYGSQTSAYAGPRPELARDGRRRHRDADPVSTDAESPYEDLRQTYRELNALLDSDPPIALAAAFRYGSDGRRRFRHWLNDSRAFDDRTSAWLSRTFGDDHPALGTFKRALSAEDDANFAYRLTATLRNLSTHACLSAWWGGRGGCGAGSRSARS